MRLDTGSTGDTSSGGSRDEVEAEEAVWRSPLPFLSLFLSLSLTLCRRRCRCSSSEYKSLSGAAATVEEGVVFHGMRSRGEQRRGEAGASDNSRNGGG